MVYSLCIIVFLEKDRKLEALEEVTEVVSRFQHVIKDAVWVSKCLLGLTIEYLKRGASRKGAKNFLLHSNISTKLEDKLELRYIGVFFLDQTGELGMALEVIKDLTRESMQLDESLWRSRILLCTAAAALFDKGGETDLEIGAREEACRIVCAHATIYDFTDRIFALHVFVGMSLLLHDYGKQRNWFAAYKLIESMDAYIGKHFCGEPTWIFWQVAKHTLANLRGDHDIARELLLSHKLFTDDDINSKIIFEFQKSRQIAKGYACRGRFEKAIKGTEKMLELIQNISPPMDKHQEELVVHILRSDFYSSLKKPTHALDEMEKVIAVVEYQDIEEYLHHIFVRCLCTHAVDWWKNGNVKESTRLMGIAKSKVSRCNNALELAEVEFSEAGMLDHEGQWLEVANESRPLMMLLMEEQRRFGHLDPEPISWLSFSRRNLLNEKLWYIESLYTHRPGNPMIGLVWAERSQQRFFTHQIYNQTKEIAIPNPSNLDECDQLLATLIIQTTSALKTKTSIIEYSYDLRNGNINMCVVAMSRNGNRFEVWSYICHLPRWFEENGLPRNKSLQELIADAIDEQGPIIEALSILHALLIQSIEEFQKGCDSLIFVPGHGCLAKIPFAALYDGRHGKHLIADYNTAVVPSIVTLRRCLYNQYNFERYDSQVLGRNLLEDSSLEPEPPEQPCLEFDGQSNLPSNVAFMAGNPKPMACGLPQLGGAEEEAKNVAAFLNVTPRVGKDMTKQAVIEGLSTSKVILLATHGVVNDDYPHGCLVLQASPLQPELDKPPLCRPDEAVASTSTSNLPPEMDMLTLNKELNDIGALTSSIATPIEVSSALLTTAELSKGEGIAEEQEQDVLQHDGHQEGKRSLRLFEFSDEKTKQETAEEASQVLTAEEIVALKGGIRAGLVVLSACQSGLGEATTGEGLLGFGRALLLAGAVSTILTLWEVNDVFTSRFIIELFKELLSAEPQGRSVDECMRNVMLNMLREGQPLKHWAAFTIVGSPALRLLKPDNSTWGASLLDKHSYHPFGIGSLCPVSCRMCKMRKESSNSESSATISLLHKIPLPGPLTYHGRILGYCCVLTIQVAGFSVSIVLKHVKICLFFHRSRSRIAKLLISYVQFLPSEQASFHMMFFQNVGDPERAGREDVRD